MNVYRIRNGILAAVPSAETQVQDALWYDLLNPSQEELAAAGAWLGLAMPSHADMQEIEASSRLYQEDGGLFMTAVILSNTESETPGADVVTFVLARGKLATLRYIDPHAFRTFLARADRGTVRVGAADQVLGGLLDAIIDRMADVLERISDDVEGISHRIFAANPGGQRDFPGILRDLGRKNDLTGKMRQSLVSIGRVISYMTENSTLSEGRREIRAHLKTLSTDIQSLLDHSSYVAGKINYLQDATLGLINIDQNNIIKIMSVAAMVFLPPTLFASIWGMNFRDMPELHLWWGYPMAAAIMVASAIVPYLIFKRKGWL